jgi:hypothetical protein
MKQCRYSIVLIWYGIIFDTDCSKGKLCMGWLYSPPYELSLLVGRKVDHKIRKELQKFKKNSILRGRVFLIFRAVAIFQLSLGSRWAGCGWGCGWRRSAVRGRQSGRLTHDWCATGVRLVCDWCATGVRLVCDDGGCHGRGWRGIAG